MAEETTKAKKSNKGLIAGIIAGAAVLVAAIVVILIIVLSGGKKIDIVGTWKLTSAKQGDTDYTSLLEAFGGKPTITFNEDGTGEMEMSGSKTSFKYDKDNLEMTQGDEKTKIDINDNKITITSSGMEMVFEKQ